MKLRSIELLRGFAALWVVMFHIFGVYNPLGYNWKGPVAQFLEVGHSGVDLFFVISGFVIGWTTFFKPNPMRSPVEFVIRRFFRVVPLYWMATLAWMFWYPDGIGLGELVRSFAFIPSPSNTVPFYGFPIAYIGWSLNYEIYFYVMVLAVLLCGLGWRTLLAAMGFILLGVPLLAFRTVSVTPMVGYEFAFAWVRMATNPLVWEFIMGVGVAALFAATARLRLPRPLWALLGAASVVAFVWSETSNGIHFSLVYRGLPSALLVYAMLEIERRGVIRFGAFSELAGGCSYALYLSHPFIINYAQRHWFLPPKMPFLTANAFIVLGVASVVLAAIIHKRIEQPIIQFGVRCSKAAAQLLSRAPAIKRPAGLQGAHRELNKARQEHGRGR